MICMKIYIINLEKDVDRKNRMISILEKAGVTNYEFIKAVDGSLLSSNEKKSLVDFNKMTRLCRELTPSEIGCSLSHQLAYRKIIEENKEYRCIILEDDVILNNNFKHILDSKYHSQDIDLLFFGLSTSNIENEGNKTYQYIKIGHFPKTDGSTSRCYFTNNSVTIGGVDFYEIDRRTYTIDLLFGTYAYSPSKQCCQKMLELNTPVIMEADGIWNRYDKFKIYAPTAPIITVDEYIQSHIKDERQLYNDTKEISKIFMSRKENIEFNK